MRDDRGMTPDERLVDLLSQAREARFRPGFAERVMRGVAGESRSSAALGRQFQRLAPVAIAAIVGLFVYNVWISGSGRPTLEEALGLREVTIAEAYSMEAIAPKIGTVFAGRAE